MPILSKNPDDTRVKCYVLGPNGEAGAVLVEVDEVSLHVTAHQRHPPLSTLSINSVRYRITNPGSGMGTGKHLDPDPG
jgi:hypothetical protein